MKDKNVGFIGLGNIGAKIAHNILLGGYNLFIHDLDKKKGNVLLKKGAIWSPNIKNLCNKCTIIITCLPSPKAVVEVIEKNNGLNKCINKKTKVMKLIKGIYKLLKNYN